MGSKERKDIITMSERNDSLVNKWHSVYFFIPLFENSVTMPTLEEFNQALSDKFGKVTPFAENPEIPTQPADLLGFVLWDHPAYYTAEKQSYPTQLNLMGPDVFDQSHWDEMILAQFWDCPDRENFIKRCRYSIMASNFMAAGLPIMERFQIIADYADMILEVFPECIGIYWPHSQKLVTREYFQQSHWNFANLHFLDGGLNVRFFNITGTNEMLFDTLGFTPIGLPDLQCHCKELVPNDVVYFLRNLAVYLYEAGDIIQDGNTVEGIDHGKWRCQREDSMAKPKRMVLDIHAGQYAAGSR